MEHRVNCDLTLNPFEQYRTSTMLANLANNDGDFLDANFMCDLCRATGRCHKVTRLYQMSDYIVLTLNTVSYDNGAPEKFIPNLNVDSDVEVLWVN